MKTLKEYIVEGLLDRVKNKEVNHEVIVREFLEENYNCQQFTISNKDGKFVVDGTDILVTNKNITSLTNNFFIWGKVKRNFDCSNCKSLTSLEGAPEKVGETFRCRENKFSIEDIKKVVKAKRISI